MAKSFAASSLWRLVSSKQWRYSDHGGAATTIRALRMWQTKGVKTLLLGIAVILFGARSVLLSALQGAPHTTTAFTSFWRLLAPLRALLFPPSGHS